MTPSLSEHLASHKLLTKKEESKLADIIYNNKKGKQEAIDTLVLQNLKLASKMAHDYSFFRDKEDLFTEAVIALQQSAARFKPGFNAKFSTYAALTIKSRILRYINKNSNQVTPSNGIQSCMYMFKKLVDQYQQEHGVKPTNEQLAEILGISEEQVDEMSKHQFQFISLDADYSNHESSNMSLKDTLQDVNAPIPYASTETLYYNNIVHDAMKALNSREKNIISERFGLTGKEAKTLESIGKSLGVTRERTRQIQQRALIKLRKQLSTVNVFKN